MHIFLMEHETSEINALAKYNIQIIKVMQQGYKLCFYSFIWNFISSIYYHLLYTTNEESIAFAKIFEL